MHTPRAAYPCPTQEGSRGGGHLYMAIPLSHPAWCGNIPLRGVTARPMYATILQEVMSLDRRQIKPFERIKKFKKVEKRLLE